MFAYIGTVTFGVLCIILGIHKKMKLLKWIGIVVTFILVGVPIAGFIFGFIDGYSM